MQRGGEQDKAKQRKEAMAMTRTLGIPRMEFSLIDAAMASERVSLAKEAAEVLGYERMQRSIGVPGSLIQTLRELDIHPLLTSHVERYKRRKAKPGMWSNTKVSLCVFAVALGLGAIGLVLGSHLSWHSASFREFVSEAATVVLLAFALAMLWVSFSTWADDSGSTRTTREWRIHDLSQYSAIGAVPDYALNKAVAIVKANPKVQIWIEQLYEKTETTPRRDPDPFIKAVLGDECYYFDVWEDREYERLL